MLSAQQDQVPKVSKRTSRTFSPEFRLETAKLVVDQGYTHDEAAKTLGVGFSTIGKWVKQLQQERQGVRVKLTPMTPEQLEIRELKKRNERLESSTAQLMSDSMNNPR